MKKRNLFAIAAVAVLLAACIPSVYPFYTDKDVVYDPHLVGEWQEKDETNNPEMWTFEQSTNYDYKLKVVEHGKTGEFTAHLFNMKNEQFLDLIPSKVEFATNQADLVNFSIFAGHLLVRMPQIEPNLKMSFCDFDWLQKYLEKNPGALAHHQEENSIVITAETRDLQKFVLKHMGTNELFPEVGEMVRLK